MKIVNSIIGVLLGLLIGSMINGALIQVGGKVIPLPEGFDGNTMNELSVAIQHFQFQHFIFPFLAHAIGTLIGSVVGAWISTTSYAYYSALLIGILFLSGGVYMVFHLPSPLWFDIIDLGFAYIPMAILGYVIANRIKDSNQKKHQTRI